MPIPEGYHAVTPWVITRDTVRLLDFLAQAFDAVEKSRGCTTTTGRSGTPDRIGDSVVMMFDTTPEWPDTPAFLRLYVKDGDAVYERALAARHDFGDGDDGDVLGRPSRARARPIGQRLVDPVPDRAPHA